MKNRTKFAAVAIALMASSAMALMPDAGVRGVSIDAKLQYAVGLTPADFPSLTDYLNAMIPWPSHTVTRSILAH